MTPRSSRSAPAAGPVAAPAPTGRPPPPGAWLPGPGPDRDDHADPPPGGRPAAARALAGRAARRGPDPGSRTRTVATATTTRERSPLGGVPVGDWLAGFQHAARELFGDDWEPQLARFLAFLRRRVTGDYVVDDYGFDPEVTERFLMTALRPIAQKWFRIELRGADNIPEEGGALVVSNHSGTIPVDGLMTMLTVHDATGRHLRPLGADLVFEMPVVGSMARRSGATLACQEDAERMLAGGELVGVWPEGFKGIGKPYSERYKLQRFGRGGFVSAAIRTGVPIVPLSVVGAEEIYPLVGNIPALARLLGAPYVPITPFFPWLGPLGLVPLPSKWLLELGEPIRTDDYDAGAADDPMLVFNVTDQVRETIQQTLYRLLMQRESVFRGRRSRRGVTAGASVADQAVAQSLGDVVDGVPGPLQVSLTVSSTVLSTSTPPTSTPPPPPLEAGPLPVRLSVTSVSGPVGSVPEPPPEPPVPPSEAPRAHRWARSGRRRRLRPSPEVAPRSSPRVAPGLHGRARDHDDLPVGGGRGEQHRRDLVDPGAAAARAGLAGPGVDLADDLDGRRAARRGRTRARWTPGSAGCPCWRR